MHSLKNEKQGKEKGVKKKYSLTKFIGENMTLKELEKLPPVEQEKFLTKQLTNAVNAEVRKARKYK